MGGRGGRRWGTPIPLLVGNTEREGGLRLLTPSPLPMTLGNWIGVHKKMYDPLFGAFFKLYTCIHTIAKGIHFGKQN